jgi:hypothetical protein
MKLLLWPIILCTASAGCGTFWQNTARNLTEAPIYGIDEFRITRRNHRLAREAWEQVSRDHAERPYSEDYGDGFIQGFADYLEYGRNAQPPAVPPFRYRLSCYQTPEGLRAIEDWYAGFQHGATTARASGLRELTVIPLSAPPINAVDTRPQAPSPPSALLANPSELPPPRPLNSAEKESK